MRLTAPRGGSTTPQCLLLLVASVLQDASSVQPRPRASNRLQLSAATKAINYVINAVAAVINSQLRFLSSCTPYLLRALSAQTIIMSTVKVSTTFGQITLKLRPDAAPKTVEHFCKLAPLFDGCCFYRSDFVIQGGLQRADGSSVQNPMKPIPVNETHTDVVLSNVRGTAAFGHWDVPDAGNSDWFINLKDNAHLDSAYGGYAVFAAVDPGDAASFATIDSIARNILEGGKPTINFVHVE